MKIQHCFLIGGFLITTACATSSSYVSLDTPPEEEAPRELIIPAGVDSVTAAEARELADSAFVSYQRELEAEELKRRANAYRAESDTLWHYLSLEASEAPEELQNDPGFIDSFNEGAEYFTEAREIAQSNEITEEEMQRYSVLANNAIDAFEDALRLNPFDSQTRLVLAQLYSVKASRLNQEENYKKAIDILEKLVRIERGEHIIYSTLGENYFLVNSYELAAKNFEKAAETLHNTVPLTDYYFKHNAYSPQDSLHAFLYTYYAGQALTNLFDADRAIELFETAKEFATSHDDIEAIESEIDFINWDEGNILGSVRRDSLAALVINNQLEQAETGFLELRHQLKTTQAQDEIDWRLGVVQYQLGKEDEAADRLLQLVQRTEINDNGTPVNEMYERYFNDFGIITYNIGLRHDSERDRSMALKYFQQSAKVSRVTSIPQSGSLVFPTFFRS